MKKLTFEQISEVALLAYAMLKKGRGLREGQAVYNAVNKLFPEQLHYLEGDDDCYYNSERIPRFLRSLADDNAKQWVDKLTKEVYAKV